MRKLGVYNPAIAIICGSGFRRAPSALSASEFAAAPSPIGALAVIHYAPDEDLESIPHDL